MINIGVLLPIFYCACQGNLLKNKSFYVQRDTDFKVSAVLHVFSCDALQIFGFFIVQKRIAFRTNIGLLYLTICLPISVVLSTWLRLGIFSIFKF